jgi:hypothetical protein
MTAGTEVLGNRRIGGQESLRLPRALELLLTPLSLAGKLMGVFRLIVQGPVLPMFDTGENLPLRGPIAFQE